MWSALLREQHQARVEVTDAGHRVTVSVRGSSRSWRIRRLRRTPRPSEISSVDEGELLWLPAVTPALRQRLDETRASWVTDSGEARLLMPSGVVAAVPVDRHSDPERPGPTLSSGAQAVVQFLLEHPAPATQQRIASAIQLSQPRVSQVLRDLVPAGLAARGPGGWSVPDPATAFDVWLGAATAPVVLTTTWYSLAPARHQIAALTRQADAQRVTVLLCGDWAADRLAPWRPPGQITMHADRTIDLDGAEFVPAPPSAATLALHIGPVPQGWRSEPRILAAMGDPTGSLELAPVTEVAREIDAAEGADVDQAVAELRAVWLQARAAVVAAWDT